MRFYEIFTCVNWAVSYLFIPGRVSAIYRTRSRFPFPSISFLAIFRKNGHVLNWTDTLLSYDYDINPFCTLVALQDPGFIISIFERFMGFQISSSNAQYSWSLNLNSNFCMIWLHCYKASIKLNAAIILHSTANQLEIIPVALLLY